MPIYLQIVEEVKRAIALGQLLGGDQLPTVKQLATDLVINPNTAAKAYRDLEREGIIETFPGRGSFVSAKIVDSARREQVAKLTEDLRRLIRDAAALGLTPRELTEQFEKEVQNCYWRDGDVIGHRNRASD